jgi:bifunctional non-homologous end joining protein LigD
MTKFPRKSSKPLLAALELPLRSRARKARDPDQPQLPLDPMPERIEPALALLKSEVPKGPQWLYEIKWDGHRLAIHVESVRVRS